MSANAMKADIVVCHYNRLALPHMRWMALHSMAFLMKDRPEDLRVVFVDGSAARDETLDRGLGDLGVEYVHAGRELSFAETYNTGIRRTSNPVVVAMANDILIEAKQVRMLADEVSRDSRIGCVFPYLSVSDYGAQRCRRWPVPRRCFPTRMTLNVNAFSRAALDKVGLIPEQMTGCFNDVLLFIRLREQGWSVVLRNVGRVIHLGRQTLKTGATSVAYRTDAELFAGQFPEYWRKGEVLFHRVAQRWTTRGLYRLIERMPGGLVRKLGMWNLAWAVEPYVCAESGTFAEGFHRLLRRVRL
jgi:GT2 family glycosyltransferase